MASAKEVDNALRTIVSDIVHVANLTQSRIRKSVVEPPKITPVAQPTADITTDTAPLQSSFIGVALAPYKITETLAAFIVRATVLEPKNNFDITQQLGPEDVDRLIKICVEKLIKNDDFSTETIKMQVYFDTNFPLQTEFLRVEKNNRLQSAANLLRDIHETRTRSVPVFEALYRKIVSCILILGNNGSPTDLTVVREATAALESVFPPSEMSSFMNLTKNEKEAQINGLVQLVTGIRLFNKQLGKGGAGIEEVPTLCDTELLGNFTSIHSLTRISEDHVQKLTTAIDFLEHESQPSTELSQRQVARYKSGLCLRRQLLLYLTALQEQMAASKDYLKTLNENYTDKIRELKHICRAKSAVPVELVYPHFITLAAMWTSYQDALFILALRRGILETLEYFSQENERLNAVPSETLEAAKQAIANNLIKMRPLEPEDISDLEIVKRATKLMTDITLLNNRIEVLHPGNTSPTAAGALPVFTTPNGLVPKKLNANGQLYWRLVIEFGGFCPYNLSTRGLLLPGDWNHGLLRYKNKLYAFNSVADAKAWSMDPDKYNDEIVNGLAKRQPDLVQLLHLYQYIPIVDSVENAKNKARHRLLTTALKLNQPQTSDSGAQTDTHILYDGFSHVDPSYHWNEWDLRRRALMLVSLRKKATHSTQSVVSHFRKDATAQCYIQGREHGTQTRRDNATTMPRRVNYIQGLRGGKTGKLSNAKVVDLTLDL